MVNGITAKPSKEIKVGDKLTVRKRPVLYNFVVKQLVENRLPAKLVAEYYEDQTSLEELDKLKINVLFFTKRNKGTGRPTKKERRLIDQLNNKIHK